VGSSGFAKRISIGKPEHRIFNPGSFRLVAIGMQLGKRQK